MKYTAFEVRPFGGVLKYPAIPASYLYTIRDKPQVMVFIDDMPAVCVNGNCDYEYIKSGPIISGMSFLGSQATITGTDLPTDFISLEIGFVPCIVSDSTTIATSKSASEIVCELKYNIPAGTWKPELKTSLGFVAVEETVVHQVALAI